MPKKGSQGEKKEAGRARAADVKKIDSMDELLTRVSFDTEEHDEALFSLEQGEAAPEPSEPAATAAAEETSVPEKKVLHKLTDKLRRKGAAADVFSADYRSLRAEETPPSASPEAEESTFETVSPRDPFAEPAEDAPEEAVRRSRTDLPPEEKWADIRPLSSVLPENQDLVTGGDILTEEDEPEEETAFSKENEHQPKIAFTPRTDRKRKGRRRYGVFVGSLVLLLALVGVVFLVSAVSGQIRGWFAGEEIDLRSYDGFLAPVVMQDPAPFESIEGANSDMVITAGLWYMLMNQSDKVYTEYDESGRLILPLGEVVTGCRALFGPDCPVQPHTPAGDSFFEYNTEDNQFYIEIYSTDSSFAPYVSEARRSGDSLFLKVGYVSAADDYRIGAASEPTPVKYMEYELKTDPETGKEYISAIRSAEAQ